VYRRAGDAGQRRDGVGTSAEELAQQGHVLLLAAADQLRRAVRPAAAVFHAAAALRLPPRQPAVVPAPRDAERRAGSRHRHAGLDRLEDLRPPPWGHPSVGVTMHLEPSRFGWCEQPHLAGFRALSVSPTSRRRTARAFVNSDGGVLFIGVGDEGEPSASNTTSTL